MRRRSTGACAARCAQVGLNYDDVAERSPFELSGGQMRRVAIAGVLAMHPRVLILDEPTAGLDPAGRNSILRMIRELHAAGGLTVIMVSHSMDDISTLATRLVVMSRGELVMTGTPREVFSQQEELRSIGLGVPQAAELAHALIAEGFPLPADLYTLDEVCAAIRGAEKQGGARMLRDITLGQYIPGDTVIHRLDPRCKIILTILLHRHHLLRHQPCVVCDSPGLPAVPPPGCPACRPGGCSGRSGRCDSC